MKVALIGYGKMGKIIHQLLLEQGIHEVLVLGSQRESDWEIQLKSCDVAIEFTRPDQVLENLRTCFRLNVPVVTGTTGWQDAQEEIMTECRQHHAALFYASNFSIGVHLFRKMAAYAAHLMAGYPDFKMSMDEEHHIHKKDAPSGTAIWVAEEVLNYRNDYQNWRLATTDAHEPGTMPIFVRRQGETVGLHTLRFRSPNDEILLTHNALNRSGFASGAIAAAKFLLNKKGCFTMDDLLTQPSTYGT